MIDEYYSDRTISESLGCEFNTCITEREFRELMNIEKGVISGPNKGKMSGSDNPMYGKKHSEETKAKMKVAHGPGRNYYTMTDETRKRISDSHKSRITHKYITPWGEFTSTKNQQVSAPVLRKWCKENDAVITKNMIKRSPYLQSIDCLGKTFKELGFSYANI